MRKKKALSKFAWSILLVGMLIVSAFAATADFSGELPAKHGDTEISAVKRQNGASIKPYFDITITTLGGNGDSVRAWTEVNTFGVNCSSPYNEVRRGHSEQFYYYDDTAPAKGLTVTLNLDNPVYNTSAVSVSGSWSPN